MYDERNQQHIDFEELILCAKPTSDDDWGSDRQVDAETFLYDSVVEVFGEEFTEYWLDKAEYCKMTIDESLDFLRGEIEQTGKLHYQWQ